MGNDFKDLFGDWHPEDEGSGEYTAYPEKRPNRALNEKEVRVVNVFEITSEGGGAAPPLSSIFVLLRDNSGRQIKVFVGRDVAYAISLGLERQTPDRPFTHDLLKAVIDRLGGSVDHVVIDDLMQETFYAKVALTQNGVSREIDARPSDAIALALRCRAPIYVAEAVLESAQEE